jgi:glycosyltransferase involved in cell wall biosynthesis
MTDLDFLNDHGLSIVLGTYNRKTFLKMTIESIRKELSNAAFPHEIIVIDGGSDDGTLKWLSEQKDIVTIIQHNRGSWLGKQIERKSWGYFMNLGFKCAHGKYICMLSDDCLVVPGAIINGYSTFDRYLKENKNIGALAFFWREWPEQAKYWVGTTLGGKMYVNHGLYLKKALNDVGYVDEVSFFFYHADGDLCLKLWKTGYLVQESPDSYIEHFSHANMSVRKTNQKNQKEDWNNYIQKWKGIYYFDNESTGSWIEKEFQDPQKTYKLFLKQSFNDPSFWSKRVFVYTKKCLANILRWFGLR